MDGKAEHSVDITRPLSGVKILDFSTTLAGPVATRYLSDYGATVIKVETSRRPDTLRTHMPFGPRGPGIDRSAYFALYNAGKLSIALDMEKPGARSVAVRLVRWADILLEAFTPRVMKGWGLSYDEVRTIKPDIIMASQCLQGQTGPHRDHRGYGQMASALTGWYEVTGWPDREPVGPYGAYSDFITWGYLQVLLLAALDHRDRTGEGQYIDVAQYESALNFATTAILDYDANGRVARRNGNRDETMSPHGVFPCAGEDRWCAIAVRDESEWRRFCECMGAPGLADDPRFATLQARKLHEDLLESIVSEWTATKPPEEVQERLQKHGVAAGMVARPDDLFCDPQFAHRTQFMPLEHPELGPHHVITSPFRLSGADNFPSSPAPLLGQHTDLICREFLGMSEDEIAQLAADGVFE